MPYHAALGALLDDCPEAALKRAMGEVTKRYHTESGTGERLLTTPQEALAYAAARMDATRAAAHASLEALHAAFTDFAPDTLLDVGAGTGAATFAALDVFPGLSSIVCAEREAAMAQLGQALMTRSGIPFARYISLDITREESVLPEAELVVSAYMLGELAPDALEAAALRLFAASRGALVLAEPGTKAGHETLKRVRTLLLARGAHLAAPCTHEGACPLPDGDWCHFTRRVARTRLQKRLKGGEAPYEDEHFAYLCVTRASCTPETARVLRHPQIRPGHIALALCTPEGVKNQMVTKKEKEAFRTARNAKAGDGFPYAPSV